MSDTDHASQRRILGLILGFTIVSTLLHYTHNFVAIEDYPRSDLAGETAIRIAVLVSWPLFTAAGVIGWRWFARRRFPAAQLALIAYSPVGLVTLGHFVDGNPDIPAFFYATIFTDFAGGLAVLVFALVSLGRLRRSA